MTNPAALAESGVEPCPDLNVSEGRGKHWEFRPNGVTVGEIIARLQTNLEAS
jgi:hypothetical protein